jgi:hypothetical protein
MLLQDPVNPLRHFFLPCAQGLQVFLAILLPSRQSCPPFGATPWCVLSVARYEVAPEAVTVTETRGYERHWRHFCLLCGLQL